MAYTAQARKVLQAWLLLQSQEDAAGYSLPGPWLQIALQVTLAAAGMPLLLTVNRLACDLAAGMNLGFP